MADKKELAEPSETTTKPKDRWDKIDILLKPMGGFFTGIALASVGYFTTNMLENQQLEETRRLEHQRVEETNRRLYTEIMSSREKSDSDLRKEMLNSIIEAFLDETDKEKLDEKVLALELLAYNFHDVIDLSPLFKHVSVKIEKSALVDKESLSSTLERVAGEVIAKQLASLGDGGILVPLSVNLKQVETEGLQELDESLYPIRVDQPDVSEQRYILVEALQVFPQQREIRVRLEIGDPNNRFEPEIDISFKVGFFDFPMIDNTRVSHAQRVAIALTRWNEGNSAEINLVYFPGSRASLKEKPYYDEVIDQLKRTSVTLVDEEKPNEP